MENRGEKTDLCIFIHYFRENYIPLYVILFLKELERHFDEIIVVTNTREIINEAEIQSSKLNIKKVTDEGYDMGKFYKGFQTLNPDNYKSIACINDSNVLFGKLDPVFNWAKTRKVDFWGLMDADIKPPFSTHTDNYHIQSHFIVFNQSAFTHLKEYADRIDLEEFKKEQNIKDVRKKVIDFWEIGLSQFLLSKNLVCSSFFSSGECRKKYNIQKELNISLDLYDKVIKNGVPVIKRKIINSVKIRHLFSFQNNWRRLIKRYGDPEWDIKGLVRELGMLKRQYLKGKIHKPG